MRSEGLGAPTERGQGCDFNAGLGKCVKMSQAKKSKYFLEKLQRKYLLVTEKMFQRIQGNEIKGDQLGEVLISKPRCHL